MNTQICVYYEKVTVKASDSDWKVVDRSLLCRALSAERWLLDVAKLRPMLSTSLRPREHIYMYNKN